MMMILIRSHDCHSRFFFFFVFLPFASIHFHHTNGTITHSSFTRETQSSLGLDVLKNQPDKKTKKIQQRFKKRGEFVLVFKKE